MHKIRHVEKVMIGVVVVLVFAVFIAGATYVSVRSQISQNTTMPTRVPLVEMTEEEKLIPPHIPQGWIVYVSDEWEWQAQKDVRVAFAYPPEWALKEQREQNDKVNLLLLEGDGYQIQITRGGGRGMGRPYDYESVIGGYSARTWQSEQDGRYHFNIGVIDTEFIVSATTAGLSKELLDSFLSTVVFSK